MHAQIVDDTWAFVDIKTPFPSNPVRVMGENNVYVALWYKHGNPVCGRAWNNGGVVECSFPWNGIELTAASDLLGGKIQILTYTGDYNDNGYYYEWVPLKDRRQPNLQMVRCGDSAPVFIIDGAQLGNLKISTETATFSNNGKVQKFTDARLLQNMMVICRNSRGIASFTSRHKYRAILQWDGMDWVDVNENDPPPPHMVSGPSDRDTFVSLWFKEDDILIGRCWDKDGRLQASFGYDGKEYSKQIGSFQVLRYTGPDMGYNLEWRPLRIARSDGWTPVHVKNVAPCAIPNEEVEEVLGKIDLILEKASIACEDKQKIFVGPEVQEFRVLCRHALPPTKESGDTTPEEGKPEDTYTTSIEERKQEDKSQAPAKEPTAKQDTFALVEDKKEEDSSRASAEEPAEEETDSAPPTEKESTEEISASSASTDEPAHREEGIKQDDTSLAPAEEPKEEKDASLAPVEEPAEENDVSPGSLEERKEKETIETPAKEEKDALEEVEETTAKDTPVEERKEGDTTSRPVEERKEEKSAPTRAEDSALLHLILVFVILLLIIILFRESH